MSDRQFMKAVWVDSFGDPAQLKVRDIPSPRPKGHEVKLSVRAAGLNFADTLMVAGRYQVSPTFPFTPGMEVAGVVTQLGEDVTGVRIGDRVMSMCGYGAFAEEICISAAMAFPVRDDVDFRTAAIIPITYGTTYHALVDRAALQHDEWLIVHGAGSGIGLNAVELGRLMGGRVVAVAASDEKLQAAKSYGADLLIDSRRENVRARVLELTGGRGADVVFDPIGGDVFDDALHYTAPAGRLLVLGFASGRIPSADANLVLLKEFQIVGVNTAVLIRDNLPLYRQRFEMMMRWVAAGRLRPLVGATYPLEETAQAMSDLLARRITGKAVICPQRDQD